MICCGSLKERQEDVVDDCCYPLTPIQIVSLIQFGDYIAVSNDGMVVSCERL